MLSRVAVTAVLACSVIAAAAVAAPSARRVSRWTWDELMASRGDEPQGAVPPGYLTRYEAPTCKTIDACLDLAVKGGWPLIDIEMTWSGDQLVVLHPAADRAKPYPGQRSVLRAAYDRARRHFRASTAAFERLRSARVRSLRAGKQVSSIEPRGDYIVMHARWSDKTQRLVVIAWLRRTTALNGPQDSMVCAPCIPGNQCACAKVKAEGQLANVTVGVAYRAVIDARGRVLEETLYTPRVVHEYTAPGS